MYAYLQPRLQFRNSTIIKYNQPEFDKNCKKSINLNTFSESNNNNAYSGTTTIATQKRIRRSIDILLQLSPTQIIYNPIIKKHHKFKINFMTLTISSRVIIEHKLAYKHLLRPFLQWLDKTKKIDTYLWKAELQKRMQIHYHITTNVFIPMTEIREKWNYLQRKLGLINNEDNPPSTEIKSVKNINNIEHYLAKYIAKDDSESKEKNRSNDLIELVNNEALLGNMLSCHTITTFNDYSIDGKVWDCSKNIKSNNYYTVDENETITSILEANCIDNYVAKLIITPNCSIIKMKENYITKVLSKEYINDYNNYISSVKSCNKFRSKFDIDDIIKIEKINEFINKKIESKFTTTQKELF
jgi:hypothetical protein